MRTLIAAPALLALALTATSCGTLRSGKPLDYSFSSPLFNDPWTEPPTQRRPAAEPAPTRPRRMTAQPTAQPTTAPEPTAQPTPSPVARRDDGATSPAPRTPKLRAPEPPPMSITRTAPGFEPPEKPAPAAAGAPASDVDGRRAQTLTAARRLVGMRDAFDGRAFLHHLLQVGNVRLRGVSGKPTIKDVYRSLRSAKLTYDRETPRPGDLVFFHNTNDANGDGSQNDWYSLVGVVESVDATGTVDVIVPVGGEVARKRLNLAHPEVRRAEASGSVLNDFIRKKKMGDAPFTQYLAGELYAGYASLPE